MTARQAGLFGDDYRVRLDELLATAGTGPLHTCSVEIRDEGQLGFYTSYRVTAAARDQIVALLREHAPDRLVEQDPTR